MPTGTVCDRSEAKFHSFLHYRGEGMKGSGLKNRTRRTNSVQLKRTGSTSNSEFEEEDETDPQPALGPAHQQPTHQTLHG
ncbi:hypothetical protein COCON_G00102340 [Conger conger]|uniref:Uncharacterized protein n=1 Tax=Conger conger TaxID=82655 RepID=A0A9Q1DHX8_CONCO|nr:hypothetical protein COCON_G00102340 [Conger conger]